MDLDRTEPTQRPWPPGRASLPQDFVYEHKRRRCVEALAEVAHERGAHNLPAAAVIERAQISRTTFYKLFESKEEAFEYACNASRQTLIAAVGVAADTEWPDRVPEAIDALLRAAAEKPRLAELSLVHAPVWSNSPDSRLNSAVSEALESVLVNDRQDNLDRQSAPRLEELIAGGIISVIATRLRRDEAGALTGLGDDLVELALSPYAPGVAGTNGSAPR